MTSLAEIFDPTAAFLLDWLRDPDPNDYSLTEAIEENERWARSSRDFVETEFLQHNDDPRA